jgi:methylamine methyltransferase corrinoid activation protein
MTKYGIALDIGTSGFRSQAIDLDLGKIVSTAITIRHPVPGANVIDHVNFAIDAGGDQCNRLMVGAVNNLIPLLKIDPDKVVRMAVCGNPFQLSLFQNIEIRDLAYAGKSKLEALGVVSPKRDGDVMSAGQLGLHMNPSADILIPPSVTHEIGADAIAMLLKTGALDTKDPCMVIDYGTNAEMALVVDGQVYTGSAAAGPALEGQQIVNGMLAAPGAISDATIGNDGWECTVLDKEFMPRKGDTIDVRTGGTIRTGPMHGLAKGVTGTGLVSALACGLSSGLVRPSKIMTPDHLLHLQDGITLTEKDVEEAGKAIGALRAGFLTLMSEVGLWTEDVRTAYMCGASGTYVDAAKAQRIGLVPPGATEIVQFGNTSLALARDLVYKPQMLDELRDFAHSLRAKHCMFATSETFKNIYAIELSLWCYGMPMSAYNSMLDIYHLPHLSMEPVTPNVRHAVTRDIPDLGEQGISILTDIGVELSTTVKGCLLCQKCVKECPEGALTVEENGSGSEARILSYKCLGTACRRCEMACKERVLHLSSMAFSKLTGRP